MVDDQHVCAHKSGQKTHGGMSALFVRVMGCVWCVELRMERLGIRIPVGNAVNIYI